VNGFWRGRASERGQAVVLVGITLSAMLMAAGLAIDAGQLFVARRTMQEAADAGAYAGAVVLYQGGSASDAAAAAAADVARNGYQNGDDGGLTAVTVNAPPASGPHAGQLPVKYVEVIITTHVRTALVPAQAQLNQVRVRGVAGAEPLNNGYAIMALDRGNTEKSLQVQEHGVVSVTGAGILVNSTNSQAAYAWTGSSISVDPPQTYGTEVAGGTFGTWPQPTVGTGIQRPDPFAILPPPSTTGMTVYTSMPAAVGSSPPTITLNPGVYDVAISAAGGTKIVMNTGIYVVKKGINGAGNADLVSGAGGVFIYNTLDSSGSCSSIRLTGNATSDLDPLASGPYQGLLFYQDRACTADFTISGNGTLYAAGTIYLPTAKFVMNGNNATLTGSQLVANTVDIQNGTINISFSSGTTAQPILPRLSE
jgi:hypothetical protein